ncbi:serine-threonine protein kinase [Scheffersomyces xylosifermentans]|uniref:serine-threonine protein kinase n=1 Tax=Scheffersomyces xylosifermentans TaxID=1304137 RepID=UPI00315CEA51
MTENLVFFENEFSQISINKPPTESPIKRKKIYPRHLYPSAIDPNESQENISDISFSSEMDIDNTCTPPSLISNQEKTKSLSTMKIPTDKRLLSYPMSEKSNQKQQYQFSFMRATSSSLQKKHNPFSSGNNGFSNNTANSRSATKKRLEYSRQLSHAIRSKRMLSSNLPSTSKSIQQQPSDITNIQYGSPSKYSGRSTRPQVEESPTKQKAVRNASQPIPFNSLDNVFHRLYPSNNNDRPKAHTKPELAAENMTGTVMKVRDFNELFHILDETDPTLFNKMDDDSFENRAYHPEQVPSEHLNIYERGEIIRKSDIYFVPEGINRAVNIKNYQNNFGFDDPNGNYIVIDGDHINYRYEVLSMLGNGSFGNVIKSKDHKYKNRLVATKIIKNDLNWSLQAINEIKMLKFLNEKEVNENILKYYSHFNFRSHMCIITELLSLNLYSLLEVTKFRGFSLNVIQSITNQILNGLQYMHKYKIIHCDVKPENIMIKLPNVPTEDSLLVKIIDFGSSCYHNEISYTYIQSRFYRAPEVILGANYSEKIDVWSLGCVIAELFVGMPLLPGKNELEQVGLILELFGAPRSSTILRLRKTLTRSMQKKSLSVRENEPPINERLIKKTLLFRLFDINGKINMSLLNYHNSNSSNTSIKRQFKMNSKTLEICLSLNRFSQDTQQNKFFLRFLRKIFVWDPQERLSVSDLLDEPFIVGVQSNDCSPNGI